MVAIIIAATLLHLAGGWLQGGGASTPGFRYVLPEGFSGWACVDFGVDGAPPLTREEGLYVIEPTKGTILRTSSLPNLATPPLVSELVQVSSGSARRLEIRETQRRSAYDTKDPVSRHCVFFGTEAAAALVPRPPTLTESRLGTDPLLEHFEFELGNLCEFRDTSRLCLAVSNTSRRLRDTIVRSLGARVTAGSGQCDGFDGIVVQYTAERAIQTHSSSPGRPFAFAEVRRSDKVRGTSGLVTWTNGHEGSAEAIAERFGRDLSAFLKQVDAASCKKYGQAAELRSVMEADVAHFVSQASELRQLWPWQPAIPEVSRVVRHGKPVAPLLIPLLADDPDELKPEAPPLAVQQQAAIALCRIFEVPEECGRIYCNRAKQTPDVNRGVKKFWVSRVSGQR